MSKLGIEYFSFDVDFYQDDKVRLISKKYGVTGECLIIRLLCKIYRNGYFIIWNETCSILMADDLKIEQTLVDDVVSDLVKSGFFNREIYEKYKILTSRGIQKRYFIVAVKKRSIDICKEILLVEEPKREGVYKTFYVFTKDLLVNYQEVTSKLPVINSPNVTKPNVTKPNVSNHPPSPLKSDEQQKESADDDSFNGNRDLLKLYIKLNNKPSGSPKDISTEKELRARPDFDEVKAIQALTQCHLNAKNSDSNFRAGSLSYYKPAIEKALEGKTDKPGSNGFNPDFSANKFEYPYKVKTDKYVIWLSGIEHETIRCNPQWTEVTVDRWAKLHPECIERYLGEHNEKN